MRPVILVVENNADHARLAQMTLQHAGYAVRHAVTGQQALAQAFFAAPVLVLLNVTLADEMDGFEVLRLLQAGETTDQVPVIMMSDQAQTEQKARALQAGAVGYLTKPHKSSELLSVVRNVLASHEN